VFHSQDPVVRCCSSAAELTIAATQSLSKDQLKQVSSGPSFNYLQHLFFFFFLLGNVIVDEALENAWLIDFEFEGAINVAMSLRSPARRQR
jgi:hypothetical protein